MNGDETVQVPCLNINLLTLQEEEGTNRTAYIQKLRSLVNFIPIHYLPIHYHALDAGKSGMQGGMQTYIISSLSLAESGFLAFGRIETAQKEGIRII